MLGKIITSFIDMLHRDHDEIYVESIVSSSKLSNDGAFTDFAIYDDSNLSRLIATYSAEANKSIDSIWLNFGQYSFKTLFEQHSHITKNYHDLLSVMSHLDSKIHPALNLLYSEISFPRFTVLDSSDHEITLAYESERNLVDFAEGLIAGCAEYFAQSVTIKRQNSPAFSAIFTVQLEPAHSPETTGGTAYE